MAMQGLPQHSDKSEAGGISVVKHLISCSANHFLRLCFLNRVKNGEMVKTDLNVLYIKCLSLVAMESDHSLIVFGNKSVF